MASLLFASGVRFDPVKDIPSLKDKVILVTGGNSGLGKASALAYARHEPALIYLAARDPKKAADAIADIKKAVPNAAPIEPLELDLASFDSIKRAAKVVTAKSQRLDILLLNAGIMAVPPAQTKDGYEVQFGTNHMGHALLTKLLMPTLLRTADLPGSDVRVIVLSSGGVAMAPRGGIKFDELKTTGGSETRFTLYGQSKLANGLFAAELGRRYPTITAAGIHPGAVWTNIANPMTNSWRVLNLIRPIAPFFLNTPDQGAKCQLWASVAKEVVSGEYYTPIGVVAKFNGIEKVRDQDLAKRLWEWTEEELKDHSI